MADNQDLEEELQEGKRRTGWVMVFIIAVVALGYAAVLFVGGQALQNAPGAGPILKLKRGLENITNAQPPRNIGALPPLTGGKLLTPSTNTTPIIAKKPTPTPSLSPRFVPAAPDAPSVVTFTIEYNNDQGVQLTNVRITDKIPAGTVFRAGSAVGGVSSSFDGSQMVFDLGTLAPGANGKVSFQVTTHLKGQITNKAVMTSSEAPATTSVSSATVA
ncbi:MAG: hypothetical protein ABR507_07915 [Actinomycetota bacterium]|nr:DUF11 domain-containing protein [Actinomycetota bacterium]